MNLLGHDENIQDQSNTQALSLSEVIIEATPAELREMARFLIFAADEMNRMGSSYDHLHLSDIHTSFEDSPHVVVVRRECAS